MIAVAITLAFFALSVLAALVFLVMSADDFGLPRQAKARARELFFSTLNGGQRRSWILRRRFDVVGSTGRRYTIRAYGSFNVRCGDDAFCVRVEGRIPTYDKLLAQRLLIEADEPLFLSIANRLPR